MSHNVSQLDIKDLHATIEGKEILKGVDFQVKQGEIHAVMGPNGSGKSTLASTVMGHPKFIVTKGDILFDNESIIKLAPDVRARKGLFLAFQYPYEVPGVSLSPSSGQPTTRSDKEERRETWGRRCCRSSPFGRC